MKRLVALCLFFFGFLFAADDITGFWKSLDDNGNPQCIFGVYEHEGIYYGRIIARYDEDGKIRDTIYKPDARAHGIVGNPHLCGLDILYNFEDTGNSYDGRIVDPTKGNIYKCEVWKQEDNLIVRGKLFIFGKNITWFPVKAGDLPKGFKLPNMKKFTPKIPEVN